ncbi:winged helix-turn-helix transcriptional regulator [Furfurilactobacillus sp. WILCCON 0119]
MTFSIEMNPQIEEKLTILNELHRNKWRPEIVNLLLEKGTLRFGEIQRELQITQKVLTSHLKWLEAHQIINRHVFAEVPPHVEYSLTEVGQHLLAVHEAMRVWADFYANNVD